MKLEIDKTGEVLTSLSKSKNTLQVYLSSEYKSLNSLLKIITFAALIIFFYTVFFLIYHLRHFFYTFSNLIYLWDVIKNRLEDSNLRFWNGSLHVDVFLQNVGQHSVLFFEPTESEDLGDGLYLLSLCEVLRIDNTITKID